ncbi:MAG: hypothetical protein ChlgKO_10790 [Chlamydiales bacterium]
MLAFITHPALNRSIDEETNYKESIFACALTAATACVAGAAMLLNRKTYNFQPKWIWPAAVLILTDPYLICYSLKKTDYIYKSAYGAPSLLLVTTLTSSVSFALLPRKVANIGLAAALPLTGGIALANHYFSS